MCLCVHGPTPDLHPRDGNSILPCSQRAGVSPSLPPTAWQQGGAGMGQHSGFVAASSTVTCSVPAGTGATDPRALPCPAYPCSHSSGASSSPGNLIHSHPHSSLRTFGLGFAPLWAPGSFSFSQISAGT